MLAFDRILMARPSYGVEAVAHHPNPCASFLQCVYGSQVVISRSGQSANVSHIA
jgi:hypothetical protein